MVPIPSLPACAKLSRPSRVSHAFNFHLHFRSCFVFFFLFFSLASPPFGCFLLFDHIMIHILSNIPV